MKKRTLALFLATALTMSLMLTGCGSTGTDSGTAEPAEDSTADTTTDEATPADDGTVYELKLSSSQTTGTWLADLIDDYAASISEATNGRVAVTVYHDNSLGAPADLWTMFTQGGLEMLNLGIAQAGEFPITDIVQTPFLLTTPDTAGEIMWQLYDEGKLPEFSDNMHVLTFLPTDMQMIVTVDKPIESISDFSGMKIRANNGQIIKAIESMGATAVSITTTEVFLSLSQGVIDGAISSPSAMTAFSWQDACKYLLDLPICTGMNYIGVDLVTWNSLPADLQETLDQVSQDFYKTYMETNNAKQQESIDTMVAAGMELVEPSDQLIADIKSATSNLLSELEETLNSQGYDGTGIVTEAQDIVANSQYEK